MVVMLTCHLQLKKGKKNKMTFLDVQITRENRKTFREVYTYVLSTNKLGTAYTLNYRCFWICPRWTKLHTELDFIKHIF